MKPNKLTLILILLSLVITTVLSSNKKAYKPGFLKIADKTINILYKPDNLNNNNIGLNLIIKPEELDKIKDSNNHEILNSFKNIIKTNEKDQSNTSFKNKLKSKFKKSTHVLQKHLISSIKVGGKDLNFEIALTIHFFERFYPITIIVSDKDAPKIVEQLTYTKAEMMAGTEAINMAYQFTNFNLKSKVFGFKIKIDRKTRKKYSKNSSLTAILTNNQEQIYNDIYFNINTDTVSTLKFSHDKAFTNGDKQESETDKVYIEIVSKSFEKNEVNVARKIFQIQTERKFIHLLQQFKTKFDQTTKKVYTQGKMKFLPAKSQEVNENNQNKDKKVNKINIKYENKNLANNVLGLNIVLDKEAETNQELIKNLVKIPAEYGLAANYFIPFSAQIRADSHAKGIETQIITFLFSNEDKIIIHVKHKFSKQLFKLIDQFKKWSKIQENIKSIESNDDNSIKKDIKSVCDKETDKFETKPIYKYLVYRYKNRVENGYLPQKHKEFIENAKNFCSNNTDKKGKAKAEDDFSTKFAENLLEFYPSNY